MTLRKRSLKKPPGPRARFVEASRGRPLITKRIIPITQLLPHARPTPFSRIPDSSEPLALSRQTGERSCNELFPRGMGSIDSRPDLRIFSLRTVKHQSEFTDFCIHIFSPPRNS